MKKIVMILITLCVGFTYAQDKIQPKVEKKNDVTIATYYHDNGEVQQTGAFNSDGKLQGKWTSFDTEGNKVAIGNYDAGDKVGKWFFWVDNALKEVDYSDNTIVSVVEWSNDRSLVLRD